MGSFSHEELATLSTLAYYQALSVPSLTAMEILRYWTPWGGNDNPAAQTPSLREIIDLTDTLKERGVIQKKNGYVALAPHLPQRQSLQKNERARSSCSTIQKPQDFEGKGAGLLGNKHFFEARIQAKKEGIKKRQIYLRFARLLPYVPFVRMIALTGSLATDSTDEQSDIDVLVGGDRGRIWTMRLLVTTLFQILGKRRHGTKIKNRICLNHYVALGKEREPAKEGFTLMPKALTTAHIYAQALPLWGTEAFGRTRESNAWLASFVGQALTPVLPRALCTPNSLCMAIKHAAEKAFSPLWELTEKVGGVLQKKHIYMRLEGKRVDPLEVLVEDDTLLFHYPFSRSKHALARYQEHMWPFVS